LNEFTKAIGFEEHPFHRNNRGLAYYHLGKLDDAKRDYDEAINMNPDDPFFYFNRGNVYLN
jgi:tetratricopeptide (TPR) repeat protein